MIWKKSSELPVISGFHYVRDHCGKNRDVYIYNHMAKAWSKKGEKICTGCNNFEWLDENDKAPIKQMVYRRYLNLEMPEDKE